MEYSDSQFYVALSSKITPPEAYDILRRLADENDSLRAEIENDAKKGFGSVGVDIGDDLAPSEARLPPAAEIRRALETFGPEGWTPEDGWTPEGKFRFRLQPFGAFTPGEQPFKATLMLAAKANQGP